MFSVEGLKSLVSSSGKYLWLLNTSNGERPFRGLTIEALNTRLSESIEMLKRRYELGFKQKLEDNLPLAQFDKVLHPLEFLQVCISHGHLPEDLVDHLLV